ncbi:GNAT family N-acetyltransferase [Paenibacillus faecalis]|uniref:GNAT family N-acetyltransferase n=1 Tax=Paenibacillus faecalis TaxID=2079532 RepID=UPI000D10F4B0|nr:GNAT family N-acetyltransferase [Paenibacillus faecalis]
MNSIRIVPITEISHIQEVCQLAEEIWMEHYEPIIGQEQVRYMIEKFQSPEPVKEQIESGYQYYFLNSRDEKAGYMAFKLENGSMFLSKIYVAKRYRKQGIAAAALTYAEEVCKSSGVSSMWLTVNKYNSNSIAAYNRLGFVTIREQVADIGQGYVMDDYVMEKVIPE